MTVLSAADPLRVFQDFATLDIISRGRAEIVTWRGTSRPALNGEGVYLADFATSQPWLNPSAIVSAGPLLNLEHQTIRGRPR